MLCCALWAWRLPKARRPALACLLLAIVPLGAWFAWARLTCDFTFPEQATGLKASDWGALLNCPRHMLGGDFETWISLAAPDIRQILMPAAQVIGDILSAIIWVVMLYGWRQMRLKHSAYGDLCSLNLLPLLAIIVASSLGLGARFQVRYCLPFSALMLALISAGLTSPKWRRALASLVLITASIITALFPSSPALWNQYWGDTLQFLAEQRRPNDLIAIYIPYSGYSLAYAYDREHVSFRYHPHYIAELVQKPSPDKCPLLMLSDDMLNDELLRDLRGYRICLVVCQPELGRYEKVLQWLQQNYKLSAEHHFLSVYRWADIDTYIWEK